MLLDLAFSDLFCFLKSVNYNWNPQTPGQLLKLRKLASTFSPLIQYFGLGLEVPPSELFSEGMNKDLYQRTQLLRPAISCSGSFLIAHHHWGCQNQNKDNFVYFGQETLQLRQFIRKRLDLFVGKKVLDLGSGSGALSFEVANLSEQVLGLDISETAVEWSRAVAKAHQIKNIHFVKASIGGRDAEFATEGRMWDLAVFNPPMIIQSKNSSSPYRDGGALGIEIPLTFLNFSRRYLCTNGQVLCLLTNPIVNGRPLLFDALNLMDWKILEKQCLHPHFNHSLYRKDEYSSLGIERVELWFLHFKKLK